MPTCSGEPGSALQSALNLISPPPLSHTTQAHRSTGHVPSVLATQTPSTGAQIPAGMASESLGYLGSAMLSHMATGVGALQRPLANLYFHAMVQSGGVVSLLPRRVVTVTEQGLRVTSCQPEDDNIFEEVVNSSAQNKREVRGEMRERVRSASTWQDPANGLAAGIRHHQSQILYVPQDRETKVGNRYGSTTHLSDRNLQISGYIPQDPGSKVGARYASAAQLSSDHHPQTSGYRIRISGPSADDALHPLSAVLFWDSVLFRSVRGEDKRLRFSFQPLQSNSSGDRNGRRNLFVLLDTRYHWLHSLHHLPIFACVVRRSSGIKAIDVHAFLCDSTQQAARLAAKLSQLNSSQQLPPTIGEERSKGGAFGYLPFGKEAGKSVEGQFQRRSGLRKMSGCASPSIGAQRRQYGSTPALNMLFSVAKTPKIDDTIPYDDAIYHSSMDLTRSGSDNVASHGRVHPQVSSSLDSKLKASDCLQMGSSLASQSSNTPNLKHPGKKSTRKLFSLSDLNIMKPSKSTREANKTRKALGSDSMSNLAAPEAMSSCQSVNSLSPASPFSPAAQLSPSNRSNSNNRVFFLVQEDFCAPKSESPPSAAGERLSSSSSRKSSDSSEIQRTSGLGTSTSDLYASQEITSTPTILEDCESDGGNRADIYCRPVAQIRPQKQQGSKEQVIHADVHRSLSVDPPPEIVDSGSTSPLVVNVPPGKRLSQIRFVYYDDADVSRPDPESITQKNESCSESNIESTKASTNHLCSDQIDECYNPPCSSKTTPDTDSEIPTLNVSRTDEKQNNSEYVTNRNVPCNLSTDADSENAINSGSNDLSRSANDANSNLGNVTVDVSNLNIRNEPYGFSYSVNDITTNNQVIPLIPNSELREVRKLELRRIVVPSSDSDQNFVQGKRLPRHSLADFTQFLRPSSALLRAESQEMTTGEQKGWKSSENLRIYANPRRDSSPIRADGGSNHQSNASIYSGSSLSVNSIATENQLVKMMNWQFKCPPPSVTSDYHTLQPDELAGLDSDTIRKENELKAEKKNEEIASELKNLKQGTESVQRRRASHHEARFEKALEYFP